jgi:hypothetical protein
MMTVRIGRIFLAVTLAAVPLVTTGCTAILGRAEEPPQVKVVPLPKTPIFDPADNITKGVQLPGAWRMVSAISGELITVQSVVTTKKGTTEIKRYGVPETMRLAGIVAPAPGQPGFETTTKKVNEWLSGKDDLVIEQDDKWPVDLDNRRMVQIYFKPTTKAHAGQTWNLNRMLIHTGYAVVDLVSATSIDLQKWLNDEEYAKLFVDPKNPTIEVFDPVTRTTVTKPNIKPLGLWGLGIVIPRRESVSGPQGKPAPVEKTTVLSTRPASATSTTTTSTSSTATSTTNAPITAATASPTPGV